jgi:hypothetical protein
MRHERTVNRSSGQTLASGTAIRAILSPHGLGVRQVAGQYSSGICCAAFWQTSTPGIHLSREHIAQVAALNLSVDVDMDHLD